jgi:hypothetical protein
MTKLRLPPNCREVIDVGTTITLVGAEVIRRQMAAGQLPSLSKDFKKRADAVTGHRKDDKR